MKHRLLQRMNLQDLAVKRAKVSHHTFTVWPLDETAEVCLTPPRSGFQDVAWVPGSWFLPFLRVRLLRHLLISIKHQSQQMKHQSEGHYLGPSDLLTSCVHGDPSKIQKCVTLIKNDPFIEGPVDRLRCSLRASPSSFTCSEGLVLPEGRPPAAECRSAEEPRCGLPLIIHRIRKQEMIRSIMMQIQLDSVSDGREFS